MQFQLGYTCSEVGFNSVASIGPNTGTAQFNGVRRGLGVWNKKGVRGFLPHKIFLKLDVKW